MNAVQVSLNVLSQEDTDLGSLEPVLSALVDGEVDDEQFAALLASGAPDEELMATWRRYHVIGNILRGDETAADVAQAPGDFLSGVRTRLRSEAAPFLVPVAPSEVVRVPAANDAVFRWRMVAGLASLAAVMAVGWSVLNGAGLGSDSGSPQLAAAPANVATPATRVNVGPSTPVLVNTGQGPLIRDARLEELLAEHRQNGGMSALQMSTGFIRGATYDATGR